MADPSTIASTMARLNQQPQSSFFILPENVRMRNGLPITSSTPTADIGNLFSFGMVLQGSSCYLTAESAVGGDQDIAETHGVISFVLPPNYVPGQLIQIGGQAQLTVESTPNTTASAGVSALVFPQDGSDSDNTNIFDNTAGISLVDGEWVPFLFNTRSNYYPTTNAQPGDIVRFDVQLFLETSGTGDLDGYMRGLYVNVPVLF